MVRLICLLLLVIGGSPGHADGSCNLPDSVWVTFPERGSLREDTYNRSLSTEAPSEVANLFGRQSTGKVGNFLLRDHFGGTRELYQQTQAPAVVLLFMSTGCPIVQKSIPAIKALRDEFGAKGVVFWLIDSNTEDDPTSIAEEAREFHIDLPILIDKSQSVARSFGAKRTAEVFCIKPDAWTVFYRGAIDDRLEYGTEKARVNRPYLQNALKSIIAGKKVTPARTEVKGCLIQFESSSAAGQK